MPITALHAWEEDDTSITINLLITGVSRGSLDIFASDCFIKVNAQPYLFQVDLNDYIDELKSSATIESSGIRIRAIKVRGEPQHHPLSLSVSPMPVTLPLYSNR